MNRIHHSLSFINDIVLEIIQPHLPHAPDRLVVGGGHVDHTVVVERPHRRIPAVL